MLILYPNSNSNRLRNHNANVTLRTCDPSDPDDDDDADDEGGPVTRTAHEIMLPKVSDEECSEFWGIPATLRLCAGHSSSASLGICSVSRLLVSLPVCPPVCQSVCLSVFHCFCLRIRRSLNPNPDL